MGPVRRCERESWKEPNSSFHKLSRLLLYHARSHAERGVYTHRVWKSARDTFESGAMRGATKGRKRLDQLAGAATLRGNCAARMSETGPAFRAFFVLLAALKRVVWANSLNTESD